VDEERGKERRAAVETALERLKEEKETLDLVTVSGKYNLGLKKVVQRLGRYVTEAREAEEQEVERDEPVQSSADAATSRSLPEPASPAESAFDPLNPDVKVSPEGIPLNPSPLPNEILSPPRADLSLETLARLHKLAAIAPPESGSEEETRLLDGLSHLVGLMDQVKSVQLDSHRDNVEANDKLDKEAIRGLLTRGTRAVPEDVFDGEDRERTARAEVSGETVVGKDLLDWTYPRRSF
jgi:hypothetical protein